MFQYREKCVWIKWGLFSCWMIQYSIVIIAKFRSGKCKWRGVSLNRQTPGSAAETFLNRADCQLFELRNSLRIPIAIGSRTIVWLCMLHLMRRDPYAKQKPRLYPRYPDGRLADHPQMNRTRLYLIKLTFWTRQTLKKPILLWRVRYVGRSRVKPPRPVSPSSERQLAQNSRNSQTLIVRFGVLKTIDTILLGYFVEDASVFSLYEWSNFGHGKKSFSA